MALDFTRMRIYLLAYVFYITVIKKKLQISKISCIVSYHKELNKNLNITECFLCVPYLFTFVTVVVVILTFQR